MGKDETGVHDYPEHVLRVTKMTIHETARMIRSRASRTNVRVDDLVNNYSAELATVSTPIKILKVVSKLDIMEVCKKHLRFNRDIFVKKTSILYFMVTKWFLKIYVTKSTNIDLIMNSHVHSIYESFVFFM